MPIEVVMELFFGVIFGFIAWVVIAVYWIIRGELRDSKQAIIALKGLKRELKEMDERMEIP